MKITLISPILFDLGLYTLSPQLKARNHRVRLLFIPDLMEHSARPLSRKDMFKVNEFIEEDGLIGINCFSENYYKTSVLVDNIKKASKAPIVWGGIHATLKPQDCIRHADIVCIEEGEEAIGELANKLETGSLIAEIDNLVFRSKNNDVKKVKLRSPVDLNLLLPFDYNLSLQYILENGGIRNVEEFDFKGTFLSYSSRGCPYRCSYCCNEFMLSMYKGQKYCRQRNLDNVLVELIMIKRRFPSCKQIWFNEADFLAGKTEAEIDYFSKRYMKEVDIPFGIWSNPACINDRNIQALKMAGLKWINIGTIHGNDIMQKKIYNRNATVELYRSSAEVLKKYRLNVEYDFILCNPYERDEDIIKSIHLLISLPKPFRTVIYSLTYFPRTKLYEMALRDKIIDNQYHTQSYIEAAYKVWKFRVNAYLNVVASLMRGIARKNCLGIVCYGILPEPILKILIKKHTIKFFNLLPLRSFIFNATGNLIMMVYLYTKKSLSSCNTFLCLFKQRYIKKKN